MRRKTLTIIKITGKFIFALILFVLLVFSLKYITCPVFIFEENTVFTGNKFYNPYMGMESNHWKKANFQIQSRAWVGITSGRGNSNEDIYKIYQNLNYDIIGTSDYQRINKFREGENNYIPVYEHGYGIQKSHQVLIGAKKVLWLDYPFFQTIHNKQNIINKLSHQNELVYLAHPKLRNGYKPEDMKYLSNYNGIEVLNNYRISLEHWDMALSNGKFVTIVGNDDAHDITNPDEIGHHCTYINSSTTNRDDIINALKAGNSFGARIYRPAGESFEDKYNRLNVLPAIQEIKIHNDTLFVKIDSIAKEIRFIGHGGKELLNVANTNKAHFALRDVKTYIRTEIEFIDQSIYYLNPLCRTNGEKPNNVQTIKINKYKTYLLRAVGFSTLLFIIINYFVFQKQIRTRKRIN